MLTPIFIPHFLASLTASPISQLPFFLSHLLIRSPFQINPSFLAINPLHIFSYCHCLSCLSRSYRSFAHGFHHSIASLSRPVAYPGPPSLLCPLVPCVTAIHHFLPSFPSRNRRSPLQESYPHLGTHSSFLFTPFRPSPSCALAFIHTRPPGRGA